MVILLRTSLLVDKDQALQHLLLLALFLLYLYQSPKHLQRFTQGNKYPFLALIGRDVLSMGILVYNGTTGTFSFAM